MTKKNKDWWVNQAHMYSRQVGELQDELAKKESEIVRAEWDARKHYNMASVISAQMKRCQDILETLVNELTKAQYEGKNEELLEDARTYLQLAVQGYKANAYLNYGEQADNISKSGYDLKKLNELTAESLKRLRQEADKKEWWFWREKDYTK